MKVLAVAAVALALAGCAGTAPVRAVNALAIACDSYVTLGEQLLPLKAAGKLSGATIARVDAANVLVSPYCASGSAADPAVGVAVVERAVELLRIIREGESS